MAPSPFSSNQVLASLLPADAGLLLPHLRFVDLPQETVLFDDTIYENIRYGRPEANRAEIEEAARRAHVTRFFDQMPEGFQTRVGEKGGRLSGGQRQRVALARAILRNPSILILDEATSASDAQSERLIHETLQSFVKGRTTFLITHAVTPSVLELVHKIAVMDHGELIALGPHEQVLATCPIYERLFHARSRRGAVHSSDAIANVAGETLTPASKPAATERVDAKQAVPRPEILPLPLVRSIQIVAQSAAVQETVERQREKANDTAAGRGPSRGQAGDGSQSAPESKRSNAA